MKNSRWARSSSSLIQTSLAILLLASAACEDNGPEAVTVVDSAGIRITLSRDKPAVYVRVDSTPFLSLGGPEDTGPTQFFRIQNLHVDPAGRVWVADGQSGELRIFHTDGRHWKTRGGRGEGPGEFLRIRLLGPQAGDTVLVADDGTGRASVFDPDGEFVRSHRLVSGDGPVPRLFGAFRDGSVLGQVPRIVAASALEPGQLLGDSVHLVRVDLDSTTRQPYAMALGPLWIWTGRNQVPMPFTINSSFDIQGEAVHLVSGTESRIRVFERGRLTEVYGVDRGARRVTSDDMDAYRQLMEGSLSEETLQDYLSGLDHESRPDLLPAYSRLEVAAAGEVWVRIYDADPVAEATWDVYDSERRFLGQVRTPGSFNVLHVSQDAIYGVWWDGSGVEHVRGYRLVPN
jgi:hypothetical protein